MRVLTTKEVRKTYSTPEGPLQVLRGVSLDLDAGETLALTGESGSGKSTLLHAIGGLEPIDSGEIFLDGVEIGALSDRQSASVRRDSIGIVFQQFNLVSSLTIDQNIRLQARMSGRHDSEWVGHLTNVLGLDGLQDRYPEQLSGGQQQRAAIARALALRPHLVLADEPTGNLDAETGDRVMELFLKLTHETNCALVMVTHNPRLAQALQRTATLVQGQLI
ncbi:MAG: ABC transporter ATP-binding protein [Pseudomonadota bacterium]